MQLAIAGQENTAYSIAGGVHALLEHVKFRLAQGPIWPHNTQHPMVHIVAFG